MNKYALDILAALAAGGYRKQRELAAFCDCSLGMVNKGIKTLQEEGYLQEDRTLTGQAEALLAEAKPKNAIILAAGYGMRMVPLNTEIPKGLLKVRGLPLIERTIRQLQEAGVFEIYVVVGYLKEQYEYLMDLYGVQLLVNMDSPKRTTCIPC